MTPEEIDAYQPKEAPKRKWQNLVMKMCPNCDSKLVDSGITHMKCLKVREDMTMCFFIAKKKAAEFLLDPEHPANKCMSVEQRENFEKAVYNSVEAVA